MVQKKVPTKLALQPPHRVVVGTKNHLHPQDVKNVKGPDSRQKKMKKSGSFKVKRQEHLKQPGKPNPTAALSPPRSAAAPNYMRSTTSFDARKEVSPKRSRHDNSNISGKSPTNNTKLALVSASSSNNNYNRESKASGLKKTKNPSFKPSRISSSVIFCENLESQRATCSSTLKDAKFPDYLSLNSGGTELEGTSIIKVCPYTYCSLNGHHHAPLPPLKHFLSARRRAIKVQRNMKLLGCLSPRRVKGIVGNEPKFNEKYEDQEVDVNVMDFKGEEEVSHHVSVQEETEEGFLGEEELQVESMEINVGFVEQDSEPSDMEWEIEGHLDYDYEYECPPETDEGELVKSGIANDNEDVIKSDNIDGCFDDFSADGVSQESFEDEEGFNSDAFSSINDGEFKNSYDCPKTLNNVENPAPAEVPSEEPNESSDEDQTSNPEKNQENPSRSSINTSPTGRYNAKNEAKTETEDSALVLVITKGKDPTEDVDESGQYNLRAPNFLPLEPDLESEKIDLKHQDLDERKNAEEWMVDYALRQVVTKLGPARKRKVALLVEAFEKVTPVKKCELHLRRTSGFDQARPMQTCS